MADFGIFTKRSREDFLSRYSAVKIPRFSRINRRLKNGFQKKEAESLKMRGKTGPDPGFQKVSEENFSKRSILSPERVKTGFKRMIFRFKQTFQQDPGRRRKERKNLPETLLNGI